MASPHRQLKSIRNPTPRPSGAFFHFPPHEKTLSLRGAQSTRGERGERCQWQRKRGERVAAVKISSVRRKAAQKFWAPQQGHPHPRPTHNREAGTTGPMWASAPTECLPIGFRRGRCPHRPAPGLAQSSLLSLGADASVRPLPNAPPQKRERPPGRSLLAYVFFTPPGNRLGLRPPAAGFSPGPAHPGVGR